MNKGSILHCKQIRFGSCRVTDYQCIKGSINLYPTHIDPLYNITTNIKNMATVVLQLYWQVCHSVLLICQTCTPCGDQSWFKNWTFLPLMLIQVKVVVNFSCTGRGPGWTYIVIVQLFQITWQIKENAVTYEFLPNCWELKVFTMLKVQALPFIIVCKDHTIKYLFG